MDEDEKRRLEREDERKRRREERERQARLEEEQYEAERAKREEERRRRREGRLQSASQDGPTDAVSALRSLLRSESPVPPAALPEPAEPAPSILDELARKEEEERQAQEAEEQRLKEIEDRKALEFVERAAKKAEERRLQREESEKAAELKRQQEAAQREQRLQERREADARKQREQDEQDARDREARAQRKAARDAEEAAQREEADRLVAKEREERAKRRAAREAEEAALVSEPDEVELRRVSDAAENAKLRAASEALERQAREEDARRRAEEDARRAQEQADEERRRDEARRREAAEEEARREREAEDRSAAAELERQRQDEARRAAEERASEERRRQEEDEARRAAEERAIEERRRQEEQRQDEARRAAEERAREERRRQEEHEAKRAAEERAREEQRRQDEQRQDEARRRAADDRARQEAERRRREEEDARHAHDEDRRRREEELRRADAEERARDDRRREAMLSEAERENAQRQLVEQEARRRRMNVAARHLATFRALANRHPGRRSLRDFGSHEHPMGFLRENASFFRRLLALAEQANHPLAPAEIVIVGCQGHGKTSLLEAVVGMPLHYGETKRALHVQLVHNREVDEPLVSLRNETGPVFGVPLSGSVLLEELRRRNSLDSEDAIHMRVEFRQFGFDLTLIDTPPFADNRKAEGRLRTLITAPNRLVVHVKMSKFPPCTPLESRLESLVRQADPGRTRTLTVSTHLDLLLDSVLSTERLNEYLFFETDEARGVDTRFWVTLLSSKMRAETPPMTFDDTLLDLDILDTDRFDSLSVDRRYEVCLGVHEARRKLLFWAWSTFKQFAPTVVSEVRTRADTVRRQLCDAESRVADTSRERLRLATNEHAMAFFDTMSQLMEGSTQLAAGFGQTRDEELSDQGFVGWDVGLLDGRPPEDYVFKYAEHHLSGSHQIARLSGEFAAVCQTLTLPKVREEEVFSSAPKHFNSVTSVNGWAACEIARKYSRHAFGLLLEQLTQRASSILRRQADVVASIVRQRGLWGGLDGNQDHSFFALYIRSLFSDFVDGLCDRFRSRCEDEFYETATLFYQLVADDVESLVRDDKRGQHNPRRVELIAVKLFNAIKERLTRRFRLLLTDHFVYSILDRKYGWDDVVVKVAQLSDRAIEEIFDVLSFRSTLPNRAQKLRRDLDGLEALENDLRYCIDNFPNVSSKQTLLS
eukprot:TRINITY_DN1556_c0_g1_i1.p1 TRINITY_DN1556_c0_g1~~TRINITY_DN1556_c0_g1_i1.p1  ORF type:complete len:1181 (+),score=416.61 TRINITY_DN1556_c0_g1_i1:136-3678(+)